MPVVPEALESLEAEAEESLEPEYRASLGNTARFSKNF